MAIPGASNKVTKILRIEVDSENAIKNITELSNLLLSVKEREKQITNELKQNGKTIRLTAEEVSRKKNELNALKEAEKDYKNMIGEISKAVQNELKIDRSKLGSLKQLRAEMSNLTKKYDELSRAEREGLKGKQLQKDINAITKEIKDAEYATQRFQRNVGNYKSALQGISKAWVGLAAGIALASRAIKTFASEYKVISNFEQANANLSTILGVSKEQMEELRQSALELGRTTEYTASQVTSLQTELAKLGFSQDQIINMQKPVLQFATAVGTDLASAASLAGSTLRIFQLESTKTDEVLSTLAVATNKSALSFNFLQNAMSTVGPVANAFGISVKDTAALLGTLANAGFDATAAATATRNILLNLANTNGKLAKTLGGSVNTFNEIMDALIKLRDTGIDLNETLELTDKRSVAAFNAFLSGAEASKTLRAELENVDGELDRIQTQRLDTVEGSIKLLQSAWEGFILSMSNSTGTIKRVIDTLTKGIEAATNLFRDNRIGQYAKNEVQTLQEVFDKYGAEYFEQYVKNRKQDYIKIWYNAGGGRKQKEAGERMQGFEKAVEQVDTSGSNLTFEQRLNQIQRIYDWKVQQYQNDMTMTEEDVERKTAEAKAEYEANRKAAIKEKKEQMDADAEAAKKAEEEKNKRIIEEEEKSRKERERKQKQYDDLVFKETQKAEDALVNIIRDSQEKRLAQENRNYEKSKATIEKAMQEEAKAHGTSTTLYQAYTKQLETIEEQHKLNLEKLEETFNAENLKKTADLYQQKINLAQKNSAEQFALRKQFLETQMQQELANTELTEEQKQLIREKYEKNQAQLRDEQTKAAAEQVTKEWEARIIQAEIAGENYGQIELDMLKERLDMLQRYETETEEEFLARKLEAEKAYIEQKKKLADKEVQIESAKAAAIGKIVGNLSDLLEEAGEENEEMVKFSKILALAEIAINTGVAIAKGVAQAQSVPFPENIAAVATTVAEIIANVTSAVKTVNSAKFARGGKVKGKGTKTSDSIPARLSDGEVVVNTDSAKSFPTMLNAINKSKGGADIPHPEKLTREEIELIDGYSKGGMAGSSIFPNLKSAVKNLGVGMAVPAQNQTSYTYTNITNESVGITPEQIAEALKQMPPQQVSVVEINKVNTRIKAIENYRKN